MKKTKKKPSRIRRFISKVTKRLKQLDDTVYRKTSSNQILVGQYRIAWWSWSRVIVFQWGGQKIENNRSIKVGYYKKGLNFYWGLDKTKKRAWVDTYEKD